MFKTILYVPDSIKMHLKGDAFEACMQLQGKAFRDVPGRKTMQIIINNKNCFIKQHFGVGWAEIAKNMVSFKLPILGAMTEVAAIQKCMAIGIATTPLIAYGQQGCSPAYMRSFVMTEDLGDIVSLEDLCADWQKNPPQATFKQKLIITMANLAAKLHGAGFCHRDFYLCHFVLKKSNLNGDVLDLHLIDLHRMLQDQQPNSKAVMKDIAGLMFSAMDCGFTAADWALFKQHYLLQTDTFWTQANARAEKLYAKFNSEKFQARLAADRKKLG